MRYRYEKIQYFLRRIWSNNLEEQKYYYLNYSTSVMDNVQGLGGANNDEEQMKKVVGYETGKTEAIISVMLAVSDTPAAVRWYKNALGATELWNLGSVAGLTIAGAAFFLGEPANNGWETPAKLGSPSVRIEVFCDDPDTFIARAVEAGADGSVDAIRNHQAPWGIHRQGGFIDPFGHLWLVGDKSPLHPFPIKS